MKMMTTIALFVFSAQVFACPNLTGTYMSPSKDRIILDQNDCLQIAVESKDLNQTLVLNNQYVVVLDDADVRAEGRGAFVGDVLALEVKVKYKIAPPLPRILLPVRAVNNYTQTVDGNLIEVSKIYNDTNGVLASTKTIYKKQ